MSSETYAVNGHFLDWRVGKWNGYVWEVYTVSWAFHHGASAGGRGEGWDMRPLRFMLMIVEGEAWEVVRVCYDIVFWDLRDELSIHERRRCMWVSRIEKSGRSKKLIL